MKTYPPTSKTTLTAILAGEEPPPTHAEPLLKVSEVAKALRVDNLTVRRWIKRGALEAITLPHKGHWQMYRVKQSTMDKLMKTPLRSQIHQRAPVAGLDPQKWP